MGGISGFYGGKIDESIQRIIEVLISIPEIPIWIALSAALPREWGTIKIYLAITLILAIRGWTGLARVVRGKIISLREEEFALAAKASGIQSWAILGKYASRESIENADPDKLLFKFDEILNLL